MLKRPIIGELNSISNEKSLDSKNDNNLNDFIGKNNEDTCQKKEFSKILESEDNSKTEEIKTNESQIENIKLNTLNTTNINFPNFLLNFQNPFIPYFLFPLKSKDQKVDISENFKGKKISRATAGFPHNKFADDNLRKKSKHIILSEILTFINLKINQIYNGNLGYGICMKKLLSLNHKIISNIKIEYNQSLLHRTLKDIFSTDISRKYTNFPKDHNKLLINNLLNEEDDDKRNYFHNLFNLTFLEALNHFQQKKVIKELVGLKTYKEVIQKYEAEKDYHENLIYHLTNFEDIINSKKARASRIKQY